MKSWNIVFVGHFYVGIVLVMSISCCLSPVSSRWVANANTVSGIIQAYKGRRQNSISVAPVFQIVSQKAFALFVTSAEVSQNCLGCLYSPLQ